MLKIFSFLLAGNAVPVLEWSNRLKIALGAAKGLAYLHEDCKCISVNFKKVTELSCSILLTSYLLLLLCS